MTLTDYMYQEKKEEEYLPILKTALTHRYNVDYIEKHDGRLITAIGNNTDNTKTNRTKITKKQK